MWVQIVTGLFGLGGVVGGVLLTSFLSRRSDQRRMSAEDDRRWLTDRRHAYAAYLAVVVKLLKEFDFVMTYLHATRGTPEPNVNDKVLANASAEFRKVLGRELQPALGEVQLLAKKNVAELADRVMWALLELAGLISGGHLYDQVKEYRDKANQLLDVLRNAMREELGVPGPVRTFPMPKSWPWLEDES